MNTNQKTIKNLWEFDLKDYNVWILIKEELPVWHKLEKEMSFMLEWEPSENIVIKVLVDEKYNIISPKEFIDKWWASVIFENSYLDMINEKGNIEEYKDKYDIEFSIILYKWDEKTLINKIKLRWFHTLLDINSYVQIFDYSINSHNYQYKEKIYTYEDECERYALDKFNMIVSFFNK
jgi:hypothetical protein